MSVSTVSICPVIGSKDFVRVRGGEVLDEFPVDGSCGDIALWDMLTFLLKIKCSNSGEKPSNRYVCREA